MGGLQIHGAVVYGEIVCISIYFLMMLLWWDAVNIASFQDSRFPVIDYGWES